MLQFDFESNGAPLFSVLLSLLFMVIVGHIYRREYIFLAYKKSATKTKHRLEYSLRNMRKNSKKLLFGSWQFFAGAAFSAIVIVAFAYLVGGFPARLADDASAAPVISVKSSKRTVVDTSKPWVYNFGDQPNGKIDTKLFNIEDGPTTANYNNELETYSNSTSNVRIQDGTLILDAHQENKDGKSYTSGRVDTNGSFSFIYGTVEVTAKLPRGVGTWPAAWLLPADPIYKAAYFKNATDQNHLYTLNGELDFLESVGYLPGQNVPAAHSYNSLAQAAVYTPGFVTNPYDEYHTYGIIKTPTSIEFTIDGNVYASRDKSSNDPLDWPFNQPYYLILNLSLGGTWGGKNGIDDSSAPWLYSIKSISYTPYTASK